ncbi:MAG: methionyl-tRNA formyltransferase [Vicinamibacterales bacterium]
MRILFFGTPAFAVPTLAALAASAHDVVGVVTQPDRPRGRGHRVVPGAVKAWAVGHGLHVLQPDRLKAPETLAALAALEPDLGVVAAYGRLLPQVLLDLPRLGLINVHASLLPRWRGAAPVHRAILAGDATTGVTIMRVVLALDAGPMLARAETPIDPAETSGELEARLAEIGARQAVAVVDRLASGPVAGTPQDEAGVTYAHRLERADGRLDFARSAREVHDAIRGLQPWPQAAATFRGRRVLLRRSAPDPRDTDATPGTVIAAAPTGIVVATGRGAVRLIELQMEGRAPVDAGAFQRGYQVIPGDRFEPLPPA